MIEKLTTEKIPEWAICYFWNGDMGELNDGEIEVMQKWENEMYECAVKRFGNCSRLCYEFHDGPDAEPYFSRCPAFGERNEMALPHRGEPPFLACDVYDVNIYVDYN